MMNNDMDELVPMLNALKIPGEIKKQLSATTRSEEFWTKLASMKIRYKESIRKVSVLTSIAPPKKRDSLRSQIENCSNILALNPGDQVPDNVTIESLVVVEQFVDALVKVYASYVVREYWMRSGAMH